MLVKTQNVGKNSKLRKLGLSLQRNVGENSPNIGVSLLGPAKKKLAKSHFKAFRSARNSTV